MIAREPSSGTFPDEPLLRQPPDGPQAGPGITHGRGTAPTSHSSIRPPPPGGCVAVFMGWCSPDADPVGTDGQHPQLPLVVRSNRA